MMHFPSSIYLYNGGRTESLNLDEISQYLRDVFNEIKVQVRDDFIARYLSLLPRTEKEKAIDNLAKEIAKIKVRKIENKDMVFEPLLGEINYEKERISNPQKRAFGILYDGFKLSTIFSKLIPEEESAFNHCHIIFTNQLFGTWDEGDLRYHARVSIYGFPSIISTTGIVEAPAKEKEFYIIKNLKRQELIESWKREHKDEFIDYDDQRITQVMIGYVMQVLFYYILGSPFCNDKNCRLFNAHWQKEVIQAQIRSGYEFCQFHKNILNKLNER